MLIGYRFPKKFELPFLPDVPKRDNSKYCDRELSDREGQVRNDLKSIGLFVSYKTLENHSICHVRLVLKRRVIS